jgi:hypothetical protein
VPEECFKTKVFQAGQMWSICIHSVNSFLFNSIYVKREDPSVSPGSCRTQAAGYWKSMDILNMERFGKIEWFDFEKYYTKIHLENIHNIQILRKQI